jgi:hypothetical protein
MLNIMLRVGAVGDSRIALRLRLHNNDAAPRGSGSATLNISAKKFPEENWPKIYLTPDPEPDVFESRIRIRSKIFRIHNTGSQHCCGAVTFYVEPEPYQNLSESGKKNFCRSPTCFLYPNFFSFVCQLMTSYTI